MSTALDITPRMRAIIGAITEVRALCRTFDNQEEIPTAKSPDQREHKIRPVAATHAERRRKYAVETGYDIRTGRFLRAPLEPWTCANAPSAMELYREIADAPDGSLHLSQYRGPDLDHLGYMLSEKLIATDSRQWIYMLGDPVPSVPRRSYPGAPVSDKRAAAGRQLRSHADTLVLGAVIRLRDRESLLKLSRQQRRELAEWRDRGGVPFPIRSICHEANLIKRHYRPDLTGRRWLSVDTCGRVLRRLRAAGVLAMLQPPRRYRANRSWACTPAVHAVTGQLPPARGLYAPLSEAPERPKHAGELRTSDTSDAPPEATP